MQPTLNSKLTDMEHGEAKARRGKKNNKESPETKGEFEQVPWRQRPRPCPVSKRGCIGES